MNLSRSCLLAAATALLVAGAAAAEPAHQGVAFSVAPGAKARLVQPEIKAVVVDDGSDLVAPTSIASHHTQAAIASLIRTMAKNSARVAPLATAKAAPAQPSIPAS